MKIYLFDTETGIYQGEDFADEGQSKGFHLLPEGATAIAPPVVAGGLLRFIPTRQEWDLTTPSQPDKEWRGK